MPTFAAGKSELYYESHGEGPAVVFAHGVGGNHASWFGQIGAFSKEHRVVVFDQRGFGNSNDVEDIGRSGMTDDLAALLDALKIESAVLIAQSMGGGACVGLACRDPKRVRALVLSDTLVGLALPQHLQPEMAKVQAATAQLSQAERVLGPRLRQNDPDRALLYGQIASFNSVNLKTIKGDFKRHPVAQLAETKIPILFVVGEDDVLVPPRIARAVHEMVPGSRFELIAGVGHSANFEAADEYNRVVLDFLRSLPPVG